MQTSNYYDSVAVQQPASSAWRNRRIDHNQVKRLLLKWIQQRMSHVCRICDLACGRGGDINKIHEVFTSVPCDCIDSSKESINELIRRSEEVHANTHAICADVLSHKLPKNTYDVVLMNFALHYFTYSQIGRAHV